MIEGIAAHTATLTVRLSRQLYAGEVIAVPIALATSTGARLPGSVDGSNVANHDFTVAVGGTEVTLATNAPDTTPRLVFTGHGTNTVQTATVTLTPVAGLSDRDSTTETVANVQVTAVDDTSASVTWDAVEHTTSYDVSWSPPRRRCARYRRQRSRAASRPAPRRASRRSATPAW